MMEKGLTALHLATKEPYPIVVEILLKNEALREVRTEDGETPLHIAARLGYTEVVSLLLAHEANLESVMNDGRGPLHLTAQMGSIDVARVLLDYRANTSIVEHNGQMPLHYAAYFGRANIVELLLESGAAPDVKTSKGSTAYDIAERMGHKDVMAALAAVDTGVQQFKAERKVHTEFVTPAGADDGASSATRKSLVADGNLGNAPLDAPLTTSIGGLGVVMRTKVEVSSKQKLVKQKSVKTGKAV